MTDGLYAPLDALLADPTVTEIMVNGPKRVYVERAGRLEPTDVTFADDAAVEALARQMVESVGRRLDAAQPYADARLADGSRVHAILPPLCLTGPTLTIRKFAHNVLSVESLVARGSLTPNAAAFLEVCVRMRMNLVISGGTGSGKTTMLNALSAFLPPSERIVTVEDSAELRLAQPHVISLEARLPDAEGRGEVTIRELVRNCLRMRPDRIVVGECRGGEALDMLQAMNTGHDGSLTTLHANSPRDALSRLETMALMGGLGLPSRALREQIVRAVNVLVHVSRMSDGTRKVTAISQVTGLEEGQIVLQDLFAFRQAGVDAEGRVQGEMRPTGAIPIWFDQIEPAGLQCDIRLFDPSAAACQ